LTLEQRIKRLEETISSRKELKEKIEPRNVTKIKFNGGYLKRFTRSDWHGWSGATRFDDGSEPFINDSVQIEPRMVDNLETRFEEEFYDEATVIFDQPGIDEYCVSINYFTKEAFRSYSYFECFATFEEAVRWINNRLGKVINAPITINDME